MVKTFTLVACDVAGQDGDTDDIHAHIDDRRIDALRRSVSPKDFEILLQACLEDAVLRVEMILCEDQQPTEDLERMAFLQSHAHDLKSSSGQIGAMGLHDLAADLEHLCKAAAQREVYDFQAVGFLQEKLNGEVRIVTEALRQSHGVVCTISSPLFE